MAVQAGVTVVGAVVLAFVFGPKLAAVALFFFPLMLAAGVIQAKLAQREITKQRTEHLHACQVGKVARDGMYRSCLDIFYPREFKAVLLILLRIPSVTAGYFM